MPEFHPFLQVAVILLGPAGAAWTAVRVSLNGTRQDVSDLKNDMREVKRDVADTRERVARIEGQHAKGAP